MHPIPEADQALTEAIQKHAEAYGLCSEGDYLGDFAIIASWSNPVKPGSTAYTTHYHTMTIPEHIAIGLFQVGLEIGVDIDGL